MKSLDFNFNFILRISGRFFSGRKAGLQGWKKNPCLLEMETLTLSRSLQVAILQCSCRNVEVAEVRLEQRKVRQVTHPVMVAVTLGQRQPLQRLALLNFSIQVSASLVRHLRQRSDHGFGLSRT